MRIFLISIFTFPFLSLASNDPIKELRTEKEVWTFIEKTIHYENQGAGAHFIDKTYYPDTLFYDEIKVKPYYMADFDNNGFTDLLFNCYLDSAGGWIQEFVILSLGNNKFKPVNLGLGALLPSYYKIIKKAGTNLIVRYTCGDITTRKNYIDLKDSEKKYYSNINGKAIHTDTVIYKFGGLINYNPEPNQSRALKLSFKIIPPLEIFYIESDSNGIIAYKYRDTTGKFIINLKGKLRKKETKDLFGLFEYMNSAKLNDTTYSDPTTKTYNIEVTFEDGVIKRFPYTFSLYFSIEYLYELLFNLTDFSEWEKVNDIKVSLSPE